MSELQLTRNMKVDDNGVFVLGIDGVLRAFAPDLNVTDYRQLDASQVQELAGGLANQGHVLGVDVAPSYQFLLADENAGVDGRLVTDMAALLEPTHELSLPAPEYSDRTSPARRSTDVLQILDPRQPGYCYVSCSSLLDCYLVFCYACYFPNGPPTGSCFTS
jgi:hypothetical protein